MGAVQHIRAAGVDVFLVGGKVRLTGLAALPPATAREVVDFARANKEVLLAELGQVPSWRPLGPVRHPGSGEAGILVQHTSGRLALDVGRCLLTLDQDQAAEQARRWMQ